MRSDLAVSEHLHAHSSLACVVEAPEALCIERFATETNLSTCDLHKLLPATAEASFPTSTNSANIILQYRYVHWLCAALRCLSIDPRSVS
jgi:hypothetical protein